MELNHLKYFYEVARQGSFTRASRVLRVSQPSISRIIRQLEANQGFTLFERGKKGVTLTEEGRICFDRCQRIFSEVESMKSEILMQKDECAGDLSIAASDNLCNYVLPRLFSKFWLEFPKVRINLYNGTSDAIRSELVEGRSDIGLFFTPVSDSSFIVEKLALVEFAVVCSSANRMLRSGKFDAEKLSRVFYIGSRRADYFSESPCAKMLSALGVKPLQSFETNSQETQKRVAAQEWGYTVVPLYMVREELKSKQLVRIRTPKKLESDLLLVRRRGKISAKPSIVFQDYLRKNLPKAVL